MQQLSTRHIEAGQYFPEVNKLSAREREIAILAARGLTNQQIADELVLSVHTIENHMYNLRKLGLTTRSALRSYRGTV